MNIGVDIRPLAEKNWKGISWYIYNHLKKILEIDKKNRYFLFYNGFKKHPFLKELKTNAKILVFNYPNKFFNLSLSLLNYPKIDNLIYKKYKIKIDIFWLPAFNYFCINKTPYILTVHDISFEIFPEFFTKKQLLWHKIINPKKLSKNAIKIIAVSNNTKNDLIEIFKINPKKIEVIYPGINISKLKIKDLDKKIKISNYILSLCTLEPRKNILYTIKVFELFKHKYKNFKLDLIIIGGKGWKYKSILKKIKTSKFKENIHYLGYVDETTKYYLLKNAKVLFYPSFYEGFGLPCLEALFLDCPVICSFGSSLPEIIDELGILINPLDLSSGIMALEKIMFDNIIKEKIKRKKEKIIKQFNIEISAKKIINEFNKLYENRYRC